MTEYQEQIQDIIKKEVIESEEDNQHQLISRITFSTGVTFRVLPINIFVLQRIINRFEYPDVPVEHNDNLDRDIPNPNSPKYLEAIKRTDEARAEALVDAMAVLALIPLEVPENVAPLESDEWLETLRFLDIAVDSASKPARKQAWVKYVAMNSARDLLKFSRLIARIMGASEEAVATQIATFQGDAQRDTDSESLPA